MKTLTLAFILVVVGHELAFCDDTSKSSSQFVADMATVAVVDVSPSMRGSRIQTAIEELTQYVERLPPTPKQPFVLITFANVAYSPQTLTDKTSALKAISKLGVGGLGTNIAAGLRKATEVSKEFSRSPNLLILLYSDGEDPEQSRVAAEESKLSQMFAKRATLGLSNHVSLKRWGNANARLHATFERDPNVDVTDAGELRVVPLAIHAAIRVIDAKRDVADPRLLHVRF